MDAFEEVGEPLRNRSDVPIAFEIFLLSTAESPETTSSVT
jgi:hypothetical protein